MTLDEINQLTDRFYAKVRRIPGIDRTFIYKCLLGIASLNDPDVEAKLRLLINLL